MMARVPRSVSPMMSNGALVKPLIALTRPSVAVLSASMAACSLDPLERRLAGVQEFLERFLDVRQADRDHVQAHERHFQDVGKRREGLPGFQGAEDARQVRAHEEVRWVGDESIVILGPHVFSFDALVRRGGDHAVPGPAVQLVVEDLKHFGRAGEKTTAQRVCLEVPVELLPGQAELVVVGHRLFNGHAGVSVGKDADIDQDRNAYRLSELHGVLEHLGALLKGILRLPAWRIVLLTAQPTVHSAPHTSLSDSVFAIAHPFLCSFAWMLRALMCVHPLADLTDASVDTELLRGIRPYLDQIGVAALELHYRRGHDKAAPLPHDLA